MKHIKSILVPTDLSENSRRGVVYGCALAADNQATLTLLHVANEFLAWEHFSDESAFAYRSDKAWPVDRVLAEATLDLNHFIEPHLYIMKNLPRVTKRIVVGVVAEQIAATRGRRTGRSGDHVAPATTINGAIGCQAASPTG